MTTFASLGLVPSQIDRLDAMGIKQPTEVQAAVLAVAGGDLVASAPTGSGKTIAFALPLVAAVASADGQGPHGLVLVPTRENKEKK
jgi:superfamily II DNA/RNA helicase